MKKAKRAKPPAPRDYKAPGLAELGCVTVGLGLLVWLSPLGTPGFEWKTGLVCLAVLGYAVYRLVTWRGVAERWGLPFSQPINPLATLTGSQDDTFGYLLLGIFFLVGAIPMLLVRVFADPQVLVTHFASYFGWCIVQDFIFFCLVLRNLEDHLDAAFAIPITAVLFAISHYPFTTLMAVTLLAGGVWAHAFLRTRSLMLITLSHWMMGIVLLS